MTRLSPTLGNGFRMKFEWVLHDLDEPEKLCDAKDAKVAKAFR